MDVSAGTGPGSGTGPAVSTGAGAGARVGGAIASLERAGSAEQGQTAAYAPGKGTDASWPNAVKGSGPSGAGSNENFKASWQSMLRAWDVDARASSGATDPVADEAGGPGAATGSTDLPDVDNAQSTFARAGAEAAQSALTTNRNSGPMAVAGTPANNATGATRLGSLVNAFTLTPTIAASAPSPAAIRAATGHGSSRDVQAGANVKSEKRASAGEDAEAHAQTIPSANGLPASPVDGAGLADSVQTQITPAYLAGPLGFRQARQIDESSTGASETEPEAAIAAIPAKGTPSNSAASTAPNSSANARAASQVPASAAQSVVSDEDSAGGETDSIGEQVASAVQPQLSTTAQEIAMAVASRAGIAGRQSGLGSSSGVGEHKTLAGDFAAHRGASKANGTSVDPPAASASADKLSADNDTLPKQHPMARSAQQAVAGGPSAATGQGIGTHVVAGQASAPEGSAWVRDSGGAQGTAAARDESASIEAAAPQETFAALDAGTSVGTPSWIHAGGHQAEAGFEDPALGWVGVRADLSGGSVHAALVPGSTEAAQALSGHLAGLNAYLAEQHAPVATLTMAAPGSSGMEAGVDQNMQQSAGQQGEQNPAAAPQSGVRSDPGASASAAATSTTATNGEFDVTAYGGGNRGTHISVMA